MCIFCCDNRSLAPYGIDVTDNASTEKLVQKLAEYSSEEHNKFSLVLTDVRTNPVPPYGTTKNE